MGTEIERKWILKGLPPLEYQENYIILAYYLSVEPVEVRIRKAVCVDYDREWFRTKSHNEYLNRYPEDGKMAPFKMTIKNKGDLVRRETETVLDAKQFQDLRQHLGPRVKPIRKDYYIHHTDSGLKVEISHVDDDWWYMEIEFKTAEEAEAFNVADLAIDQYLDTSKGQDGDVTSDPQWKMANYWKSTHPSGLVEEKQEDGLFKFEGRFTSKDLFETLVFLNDVKAPSMSVMSRLYLKDIVRIAMVLGEKRMKIPSLFEKSLNDKLLVTRENSEYWQAALDVWNAAIDNLNVWNCDVWNGKPVPRLIIVHHSDSKHFYDLGVAIPDPKDNS